MPAVEACALPEGALLARYAAGGYADCFRARVRGVVSHAQYVEAFYSSRLFGLERLLLALVVARPSSAADVKLLASGAATRFAAWSVEDRCKDQLLLRDDTGRTRSWLMVAPSAGAPAGTWLYFGSAVVPAGGGGAAKPRMGFVFKALLGFHKLYSRALLKVASGRCSKLRT